MYKEYVALLISYMYFTNIGCIKKTLTVGLRDRAAYIL